ADGVAHERYQGNARVRHVRAGKAHRKRIVQGQAAVAGDREQSCPRQFLRGDGVNVGEDIPPVILTQQVMQPKQGQPEQGNAQKGGPRGDLVSCARVCQARYRSRASHATLQTARVGFWLSETITRGSPRMSSTTD